MEDPVVTVGVAASAAQPRDRGARAGEGQAGAVTEAMNAKDVSARPYT